MIIKRLDAPSTEGAYLCEKACLDEAWSLSDIAAMVDREDAVYLVALYGDTVCGTLGALIVLDEMQITNVATLPQFRRRGIAGELLQEALLTAKGEGCTAAFLEVETANAPAIALYQKYGFASVGLRKGFYKGKDAYIFKKQL